ncbi:MAG: hypothetical protein OER80_13565 [Gammaproteobacteria bacterium]|nr:hypothetical protein [Gammaproteobacteria bacterium]MDH3767813.1 hypothetical protein [Gammaproteobacteria bacterium]
MREPEKSNKTLVLVHGRHVKPTQESLETIWHDALRWGIQRDYPEKTSAFDAIRREMVYFGDLTNEFLAAKNVVYDEQLDVADRLHAFETLKTLPKRKKFKRAEYQRLPGKTAIKEILADVGSPVLGKLGLEIPAIGKLAPEVSEYWDHNSHYSSSVRDRVRTVLTDTLKHSDEVMIIAHCIGAVVTFDVLWELSRSLPEHKVNVLLTLGCPLGNKTVQKKLAGHGNDGAERFPSNILAWNNVAAEDDYVCHDKTIADDFKAMLKQRVISSIKDFRIYNMAVRYGKSNPHSSIGYLIHPRISKLVTDWL